MSHTRKPIHISGRNGYGELNGTNISDARGFVVAIAIADVPDLDSLECANTIVRAVNSHEALVEALQAALPAVMGAAERVGDPEGSPLVRQIRAALSTAESKK